jgi:DNA primase
MAFPPQFLDELRARVSLVDLIGRRVKLQKRGREWVGLSPFQNEKSPSFTVVPEKGFFHCFSSGEHGDAIGWVMRMDGLSFPEAVEKLAGEVGLEVPKSSPEERAAEERRTSLYDVLEIACAWYETQLERSWGREAKAYLENRGLTGHAISSFRLGYAPNERGALLKHLKAKGVEVALAAEAGLVKIPEGGGEPRDYFFDRVLFPIADRRGRIVGFGGRTLAPDGKPKYLNTPETPLFRKGRQLYNLDRARKAAYDSGEVIVAEGYMDVIALSEAGFGAAVAPLGTAVTEEQIAELWRLAPEPIICLDGDEAGQRAGMRVAERALPGLRPGISLRFAVLPPGEDPDSLLRAQGTKALREVLQAARPLSELVWLRATAGRDVSTPERRAGLRQELLEVTGQIAEENVRRAYREDLLARFEETYGRGARRRQAWEARRGAGGRGGQSGYGGGGHGGGYGGARRRGGGRDFREPAVPLPFARPAPSQLGRRLEQGLLACAIEHPDLAAEDCEAFAELGFSAPEFDRLRRAVADAVALTPDLDSDTLKRHLFQSDLADTAEEVLSEAVFLHAPFARPQAPLAEAREGWHLLCSRLRAAQPDPDAAEAARQLAQEMGEDTLERLRVRQRLARDEDPRYATRPDPEFGDAGRKE